jgi:hypothetical protein
MFLYANVGLNRNMQLWEWGLTLGVVDIKVMCFLDVRKESLFSFEEEGVLCKLLMKYEMVSQLPSLVLRLDISEERLHILLLLLLL